MLEVGGVVDAGREHDDGRVVRARRQRPQRAEQLLAVVIDRADAVAREEAGEDPLHHLPVGEHVGHAARHAQVVLEHGEAAVLDADQVGAGHGHVDVAADAHAAHLAPVVRAAVDQLARDDAFREDLALVVDVLQEQVEGEQPLRQPALDDAPLGAGDDPRQDVVGEDPLGAFVVAVDREGHALVQEGAVGGLLAVPPLGRRQFEQAVEQEAIGVPRRVAGGEHLVERRVELVVGEQRCRRLRGRGPQHVLVGLRAPRRVNSDDGLRPTRMSASGTRISHESYQTEAPGRSRAP